jgi:hypothetical protein
MEGKGGKGNERGFTLEDAEEDNKARDPTTRVMRNQVDSACSSMRLE